MNKNCSIITFFYIAHGMFPSNVFPLIPLADPAILQKATSVIVIGGGPAGLAASAITARANYKTILFTGQEPGGQLAQAFNVENWPGKEKSTGIQIIDDLHRHTLQFNTMIKSDTITSIITDTWPFKVITDDDDEFYALSLIIATGGSPKKLTIPGVTEFWGKGIAMCTICDAPFDKGKEVAIIGDNDMAIDKALRLAMFAKRVTIITQEPILEASNSMQQHLNRVSNIQVLHNTEVKSINGINGILNELELYNQQTQQHHQMPIQSIYFALGFTPNSQLAGNLAVDKEGYIIINPKTQQTSIPGIFAAGTVEDCSYQKAGIAAGRGMQAALDAIQFLEHLSDIQKSLPKETSLIRSRKDSFVHLISTQTELDDALATHPMVIVDFFVTGCPSCQYMEPLLEAMALELEDQAYFVKINYEISPHLVNAFNIEDVPTILIFKNKIIQARNDGVLSKKKLKAFVSLYL